MAGTTIYTKPELEKAFTNITRVLFTSRADQIACFGIFWDNYANKGMLVADAYKAARGGGADLDDEVKRLGDELKRIDKQKAAKSSAPKTSAAKANDDARIQAGLELIEDDWKVAAEFNSAADTAAEKAQELVKELPSVKPETDTVLGKVKDVKVSFSKLEEVRRAAKLAAASKAMSVVETKVGEIDVHRLDVAQYAGEVASALKKAEDLADEKRHFRKIIDEINGLRKETAGFVTKANEATPNAEQLRDEVAKPDWEIWLMTTVFRRKLKEMEVERVFNQRAAAVASLVAADTAVGEALGAAQAAETAGDKPAADAALTNAKAAKETADTAIGKVADTTKALEEAVKKAKEGVDEDSLNNILFGMKGRWAILLVELLILFFIPRKEVFAIPWLVLAVVSIYPPVNKKRAWVTVFLAFAGAIILWLGVLYALPHLGVDLADRLRGGDTPEVQESGGGSGGDSGGESVDCWLAKYADHEDCQP